MENLTELEKKVLDCISQGDDFDDMPSMCSEDIADETGLTTRVIRAITTSLVKKNKVIVGEYPNGLACFHLLPQE